MPDLSFAVRAGTPALTGTLTIEIQAVSQLMQNKNPVILPPLREPVLGQPQTNTGSTDRADTRYISRAWGINWATPVTNRLNALGGATNLQLLGFECPSIDTTDMGWYATGSVDFNTDPVTITAPITGTSIYGRTFEVGDYVIWDDSSSADGRYQYEIDRITAVNGQVFTLSRSQQASSVGFSYFGAVRASHTNINFYRMLDPTFYFFWDGTTQVYQILWGKMTVSAVSAQTFGVLGQQLVNLFPLPPDPAAMGINT